jgi:hypothetical protein
LNFIQLHESQPAGGAKLGQGSISKRGTNEHG